MKNKIQYFKKCPNCNQKQYYSTKYSLERALEKNAMCKECRKISENNPFYGKKHSLETLTKLKNKDMSYARTKTHISLLRSNWEKFNTDANNHYKYNCYLNKTTDEQQKIKNKISIANKGSKNPMYGKPSPQGSGNGWSGWYYGNYFRSLLELSYLKYLIDNKISFEIAEKKEYQIKYYDTYKQQEANYYPDFYLIDSQEIVEIKPKNLLTAQKNIDKHKAAKKKFKKKFVIITEEQIQKLSNEDIKELHDNGSLKFIDRYEQKFMREYKKT